MFPKANPGFYNLIREMRVVLLNAPSAGTYGPLEKASGRYFPLGLGYIAAFLRRRGHEPYIIDPEAEGLSDDAVAARLASLAPRLCGITSATPSFPSARRLAAMVKRVLPGTPVVLGGVHASAVPERALREAPEADLVAAGEGEETMAELAQALGEGALSPGVCSGIRGIWYRDGDAVRSAPPRPVIEPLDSHPIPARDLVDLSLYRPHAHNRRGRRAATAVTSRGCPFRCIFCASKVVLGDRYRSHGAAYVVGELEEMAGRFGVDQVIFNDDIFTFNRERDLEICDLMLKKGLKLQWFCFARVDTVSREVLKAMRRAGCYSIGFGVESGDEGMLKAMRKTVTLDRVRESLAMANELGFKTQCFFVFGAPGETRETVEKTIAFAKELKPVLCFFNMLVPYPGTEAYEIVFGPPGPPLGRPAWEDWVAIGPRSTYKVPGLGPLETAVAEANRRFYYRPAQVLRMLRHASSFSEVLQLARGALALLIQILAWRRAEEKPPEA